MISAVKFMMQIVDKELLQKVIVWEITFIFVFHRSWQTKGNSPGK